MAQLTPPLEPMLAKPVPEIPPGMAYEPKWDGFRCLVFRTGDDIVLSSRGGKDLAGYFPELVAALLDNIPPRCVLDGEIVVIVDGRLDFVRLTERIHPAVSRIATLSSSLPASFIAWDVLQLDGEILLDVPFQQRREALEKALSHSDAPIFCSPQTTDVDVAREWFEQFEGAGLDGVMAKPLDGVYTPGKRSMVKIKHARECDAIVAGYKLHATSTLDNPLLGSLHLGVMDDAGQLAWIGVTSSFTMSVRAELGAMLAELRLEPGTAEHDAHPWSTPAVPGGPRKPGAVSRWTKQTKEFQLIDPWLVCTVAYDHMEGDRFRHTATFLRWRPDRTPESCTFAQLEEPVRYDIAQVLGD